MYTRRWFAFLLDSLSVFLSITIKDYAIHLHCALGLPPAKKKVMHLSINTKIYTLVYNLKTDALRKTIILTRTIVFLIRLKLGFQKTANQVIAL